MKRLFRDLDGPALSARGAVICIGAFDGLHLGHRALLARTRARADALGLDAVALSFEPLPRQFFVGRDQVARLSSPRQRLSGLLAVVDRVGALRFNARLASMSAEDFVRRVLVERLRAREVWVGPDFRFGHQRRGDLALLTELGRAHGFAVASLAPVLADDQRASATRVRNALAAGDFAQAERALGGPFRMCGRVVHGAKLGRELGYPTANLRVPWGKPPLHGIFAVTVDGAGLKGWPAVASLGTRPTVHGTEPLLEVHLFDFDGDLYGQLLDVRFVAKLREELKFDRLDALVEQMHRDATAARHALRREVSIDEALTA